MPSFLFPHRLLLKRLLISLVLFTFFRFIFFIGNHHAFAALSFLEIVKHFVFGTRFDLAAVVYVNCLIILLHIIPTKFFYRKWYQDVLNILFVIPYLEVFTLELGDVLFYPYNLKRTTMTEFKVAGESVAQLSLYLQVFWYMWLLFLLLFVVLFFLFRKTTKNKVFDTPIFLSKKYYLQSFAILPFVVVSFLIIARGGFQADGITTLTANEMTENKYTPLITNTSFVLIQSIFLPQIVEENYFSNEECKTIFTNQQQFTNAANQDSIHPNVVIILWESLSKEYVGYFNNGKGYTPFFDSLCRNGLVCSNAYANAKHSNEGLCATVASIPTWMEDCFYYSEFENNKIKGLGDYLKDMNYKTVFFHGGLNGSMKFDWFSKKCGFDNYIGKNEYPNQNDFDGSWGIWDEPFLQFMNQKLTAMPQPFCAGVFTVSSHHPYYVPSNYKNKFPKGKREIDETVAYADYSLQQFFHAASQQPWFKNTLFVITADHTSQNAEPYYATRIGAYRIPILFYYPGKLKGKITQPVQQADILPSVLQFVNYPKPFMSFGKSVFQNPDSARYAVTYLNHTYQILNKEYCLEMLNGKATELYAYQTDSLCKNNLIGSFPKTESELTNQLKARIQTYNAALLQNQLLPIK